MVDPEEAFEVSSMKEGLHLQLQLTARFIVDCWNQSQYSSHGLVTVIILYSVYITPSFTVNCKGWANILPPLHRITGYVNCNCKYTHVSTKISWIVFKMFLKILRSLYDPQ
jgi:hypothetical protein